MRRNHKEWVPGNPKKPSPSRTIAGFPPVILLITEEIRSLRTVPGSRYSVVMGVELQGGLQQELAESGPSQHALNSLTEATKPPYEQLLL
jgi:hypothetical protein